MRAAFAILGVVAFTSAAVADPNDARPECHAARLYIEPSQLAAASTAGVAVVERVAAGLLARGCNDDGTSSWNVRVGAVGELYLGDLGYAVHVHRAGGGELEVDWPFHDDHLGVRVAVEAYKGQMLMAGVRWRRNQYSLGADAFVTTYNDELVTGADVQHYNAGVMVAGGYDVHVSPKVTFVLVSATFVLFVIALGAAYASG